MSSARERIPQPANPALANRQPLGKSSARPAGSALPAEVRRDVEPRMGADFSSVRIHTDAAAGASAEQLGAEAYSVGSDIVFAPGRFRPETHDGRRLLAHELQHVKQDAGAAQGGSSASAMIDRTGSAQERQAEHVADRVASDRPIAHLAHLPAARSHSGPLLHRSLGAAIGGSVIGGIVGAAIPAAIAGALFGPVAGALLGIGGAIGGAIAGYFIGEAASTTRRKLSGTEKTYLTEIFLTSVDLDKIEIVRGAALGQGTARTTSNSINLPDKYFIGNTMDLNPDGYLTLAHEAGHVWQYQHGGLDYIPSALIPQAVAGSSGTRNAAYNWRNAVDNHLPWHRWNAEQQAECISDYNEALRRINADNYPVEDPQRLKDFNTVSMAEPYIELVREGIGAPGSKQKERPSPSAAPAGATP